MHYNGGYLIGQINKLTNRRVNELLKKENIEEFNGAQGLILFVLMDKETLTIKEIGKATGLAKTSLTSMLDRMEKKGLIQMKQDEKDHRCTLVCLSEKAKTYREVIEKVSQTINEEYYRGMKNSEISYFEDTLERITQNLIDQ